MYLALAWLGIKPASYYANQFLGTPATVALRMFLCTSLIAGLISKADQSGVWNSPMVKSRKWCHRYDIGYHYSTLLILLRVVYAALGLKC